MSARTTLVLVSHSDALARGLAELAGQMAPDVAVVPVGGFDGGLGTDVGRVEEALVAADGEVVVLADLGSAVLTTQAVLEMVDDDVVARTRLAPGPFVEGAVAAAVAAQQGGDGAAVAAAVAEAARAVADAAAGTADDGDDGPGGASADGAGTAGASADGGPGAGVVARTAVVGNRLGLHARPAAELARLASAQPAPVEVAGVDATSVLALMALGATGGDTLVVTATGAGADASVDAVVAAIEGGFGED